MNRLLALLLQLPFAAAAQKSNSDFDSRSYPSINQIRYVVYSLEYREGKKKLENFIRANNFTVTNQSETKTSHQYEFLIKETDIPRTDSICNSLGYVSAKKLNSYNNESKLAETQLELERLEREKKEYEIMLQRIDSVKSNRYYEHWEKIRAIDKEIYNAKKRIGQLQAVNKVYTVEVNLNDEQTSPSSNKVNFVHMPGAEYVYFLTQNPKPDVSHEVYQGVFMKYLFTRGKSYCSLGALKAMNADANDSLAYDEHFMFIFGQDWYSRHLGRGNNKFLNMYIGYQTGFSISYNDFIAKGIPFVSPSSGVELFKNKFILVDTNVSYWLPLNEENRFTRGWRFGGSFNFTF